MSRIASETKNRWPTSSGGSASEHAPGRRTPPGNNRCSNRTQFIDSAQLSGLRRSFATRRVAFPASVALLNGDMAPKTGDLAVCRVTYLGQHRKLELTSGRRSQMHRGDEIIVAYGHRYAPDQFEAEVPANLDECHLVAAGGIASRQVTRHSRVKSPTRIQPVGLIADAEGRILNLRDWSLERRAIPKPLPPVLVVAGTSMNSGKTTTAAHLIKGLHRAGKRVGAAKVTGTGAGGDYWQMVDAGASAVVDFTDVGHASTYMLARQEVEKVFLQLLSHLGSQKLDAIVVEVADGILQHETMDLLASQGFAYYCKRLLFAAGDAMGAVAGVHWLTKKGIEVAAISGALSASPLAARETTSALGIPVLEKRDLADPSVAVALLNSE